MGTLHQLPTDVDAHARLMNKLVNDAIAEHPDAEVAQRWMAMAQETLTRYPGPPMPSQPTLDLDTIEGLSNEQAQLIRAKCESWLQSYFEDVRDQLMRLHSDILTLQKLVAEYSVAEYSSE